MNTLRQLSLGTVAIGLLLTAWSPVAAQTSPVDPVTTVRSVLWTGSEMEVEPSEAVLTRMEHGLSMSLDTVGLEPGYTYTIWWVVFNAPENCSNHVCGLDDIFLMDDEGRPILDQGGLQQGNVEGREATRASSLRATGNIADDAGRGLFRAHLPIGDLTDDVVFGPGLLDSMGSEVHLIIRSHGPVIPELQHEQLFTVWGGCPDPTDRTPCEDVQFAVFEAPSS